MAQNKLYSMALMNNTVRKPRKEPDEYDTIWELTEIGNGKYEIGVWSGAHKHILANPAFLDGADKQLLGNHFVKLIEPGIAQMDSDGNLKVIKKPKVYTYDNENQLGVSSDNKPTQTVETPETQTTEKPTITKAEAFAQATAAVQAKTGNKLYSLALMNNTVRKPRKEPDEDTVWELTEIGNGKYEIGVWSGAHKRILANPAFLDGADKQSLGNNIVKLKEPGIAQMDSDGNLKVIKKPKVITLDYENQDNMGAFINQQER